MAIRLVAVTPVFNAGLIVPLGEMFSTDDNHAKLLMKAGSAKVYVEPKAAEEQSNSQAIGNVEALKEAFMVLKLDELRALAAKNKVTLASSDTTKAAVTEKLIEAGVTPNDQANV